MTYSTPPSWSETSIRSCLADEFPGAWGSEPGRSGPNARILRSTNLDDEGHIDFGTAAERWIDEPHLTKRRLRDGDVLLEASGGGPGKPVGRVAHFQSPDSIAYLSSNFFRTLRPDERKVYSRFLAWRLLELYRQPSIWNFQQQTTGIINLKTKNYLEQRFWLPEKPEQSRIAAVLDTADEAIARTESVIAKLRQVRAGLIDDFLTRGIDKNGKLRLPPAEAPHLYQDSALGRIPNEWTAPTLVKLCTHIGSGITPRGGQEVYTSAGVIFIRSQNVTFGGLLLDDVAYIPKEIHLGMLRSEVFAHDVLFNITGASIGRCCPLPAGLGTANVNQHVCALRAPKATAADAKFLATLLASPIGQRQMDALLTIGNRQGLNYQQLGSFVIPWPETDERTAISSQIQAIENQIDAEEHERGKLVLLRSGLMDDLLTGRVRVPEELTPTPA